MSSNILFIFIVAIANIALGVIVYSRNKTLLANKVFLTLTVLLTFWMLSNFFLPLATDNNAIGNLLNGLAYTTGFLAIYCAYIFAQSYPVESSFIKNRKKLALISVIAGSFALLSAAPVIAGTVITNPDGSNGYTNGSLEFLYTFTVLALVALIVGHYILIIRRTKGVEKSQALFVMLALAASIVVAVTGNLLLPMLNISVDYAYFAPVTSLIVIGFIAYAITRHGLFDVRPFIARSLAYFLSIAVMLGIFVAAEIIAINTFFGSDTRLDQTIFFAVLSIVLAIVFQPTKRYFDKISNKIFYRDSYNPQELINSINSKLVNTLDLSNLIGSTGELIEHELKVSFCNFYLESESAATVNASSSNAKLFANKNWITFVEQYHHLGKKIITLSDSDLPSEVKKLMILLEIEVAVTLSAGGEELGLLVVGERKSGNSFANQDIQLLEIVAGEVAIAAQNALRFEEIAQFNVTLQKKVDDATAKLQRTNEKLKALDEAKDEFISMASHQLRTPLTSVKGYVSMVLEGDAGTINDQQKTFLDQAYLSSQRMVYLIADLLNVSRLKTGKFLIEAKPTYLPDVVESEISQLYETAKARELKLVFNKPSEFPTLNLDEVKIRQVIMNFTDNAIYYTPKGGKITLDLKATKQSVEFTVHDTGIGVPKAEQHHLFMKFYRAGNAKKARPDGTGLGLFMAKKVIVAQGGAIIFKTEEGKGSTFGFTFPLAHLETK